MGELVGEEPQPGVSAGLEQDDVLGAQLGGEELTGRVWRGCSFVEVDLTEAVLRDCRFEECTFDRVRFNASIHERTTFTACSFSMTSSCTFMCTVTRNSVVTTSGGAAFRVSSFTVPTTLRSK